MVVLRPTIAVVEQLGNILTKDGKNGIMLMVSGDALVMTVLVHGHVLYRSWFDAEDTELLAGYCKTAADRLIRSGGSGVAPERRAEGGSLLGVIMPAATLGGLIPIGHIIFGSGYLNALATFIRGNEFVFRIIKDGVKFYETGFTPDKTDHVARLVQRGLATIKRQGGSAAPSVKLAV